MFSPVLATSVQELFDQFGLHTEAFIAHLLASARAVPSERLLYETDSPYLAPLPFRGKPCKPEYTKYTSAFLAELRGEDVEDMRRQAVENFKKLKSLSKGSLL